MSSEDASEVAQVEHVAELQRLLAAAQRSAETSRRRANNEATKAGRWRDARDEFVAAARAALGMGPPTPHFVHTGPILARIGEVVAERDRALAELERAGADLALSERRRADATAGANATAATLEALRKSLKAERRSIAAREGAVERRVRAVERAAEERVARASAAVTAAREEAQQQAAWTEAQLGALRAELEAARTGGAVAAAQQVAAAKEEARKAREELEAQRAVWQREALREAQAEQRGAALLAPRQPLLDHMLAGPRSVTVHRARLARWVHGDGPDVEAARWLASVTRDERERPEQRARAGVALSGLLGGVL